MSAIQSIEYFPTELPPRIFYKIQSKYDQDIEQVLICADCADFHVDREEIQATFNLSQFHSFSEMLFVNFKKTCFAEAIIF